MGGSTRALGSPVEGVAGDGIHLDWAVPGAVLGLRVAVEPDLVVVEVDGPAVARSYVVVEHPEVARVLVHPRQGGSALRVRLRARLPVEARQGVRARLEGAKVALDVPLSTEQAQAWGAGEWPRPLVPVVLPPEGDRAPPGQAGTGSSESVRRLRVVREVAPAVSGEGSGPGPGGVPPAQSGLWWGRWLAAGLLGLALLWGWAWAWRRRRAPGGAVLGRVQVGPGRWVVGVQVEGRVVVLGVAEGRCTPLAEWPSEGVVEPGDGS